MGKPVVVITGCDAKFFPFMDETLRSLAALHIDTKADIGILDLGLSAEQVTDLQARGCIVRKPEWTLQVPEEIKIGHMLGLVARTALRDYFRGYNVYLWFDADAWAQTPEFFDCLVEGARAKSAAIVRENGTGCRRNWLYNRWWYGHMIASYGLISGIRVAFPSAINIGIMALSDTAPHWEIWARYYQRLITKSNKLNLDQHAFAAALELEHLPHTLVPARCNWICTLSTPTWDKERKLFCEPNASAAPLSVLHLAGPDKRRNYQVNLVSGGTILTPLTYTEKPT